MNRKAIKKMMRAIDNGAAINVRYFSPAGDEKWSEVDAAEFNDMLDSSDPEASDIDPVNMCGELCKYGDEERGYEFEIIE